MRLVTLNPPLTAPLYSAAVANQRSLLPIGLAFWLGGGDGGLLSRNV